MRALSIRQPYAEMILRGEKTVEYRSRRTRIIGERFYIYAPRRCARPEGEALTLALSPGERDALTLGLSRGEMEPLTLALSPRERDALVVRTAARAKAARLGGERARLPTGVIVGSAVISRCGQLRGSRGGRPCRGWHLTDVRRLKRPRKPRHMPQPVWFNPF